MIDVIMNGPPLGVGLYAVLQLENTLHGFLRRTGLGWACFSTGPLSQASNERP